MNALHCPSIDNFSPKSLLLMMTLIIEVILTFFFFYSFPILHILVRYIDDIFLTSVTHTLIFPLLIFILSIFNPELKQSAHSYNQ